MDEDFNYLLKSKGVYISKDFSGIVVSANLLPLLNEKLKQRQINEEFKTMLELSKRGLEIQYKPHKTEMTNESTIRGIKIFEKNELIDKNIIETNGELNV